MDAKAKSLSKSNTRNDGLISLNSPHTLEACKRQGISANELKFISFDRFKRKVVDLTIPEDILLQQWKDQEQRRGWKIQQVLKAREIIFNSESNRYKSRSSQGNLILGQNNSRHVIDYNDTEKVGVSRKHNASKMSVSYTRSDNNSRPLAIEIKLEKISDHRNPRSELKKFEGQRENLRKYLDKMFLKEQKQKELRKLYLEKK